MKEKTPFSQAKRNIYPQKLYTPAIKTKRLWERTKVKNLIRKIILNLEGAEYAEVTFKKNGTKVMAEEK